MSLRNLFLPLRNYLAFYSYCTGNNIEVQRAHPRSCPTDTLRFSQGLKRPLAWAHSCVLLHWTGHRGVLNTKFIWGWGWGSSGSSKGTTKVVLITHGHPLKPYLGSIQRPKSRSHVHTLCLDVLCGFLGSCWPSPGNLLNARGPRLSQH